MQFVIALVSYFQQHGFDTTDWRKSVDGAQAIVHLEYSRMLIPGIESDSNATIYQCPSDTLTSLLNSSTWINS